MTPNTSAMIVNSTMFVSDEEPSGKLTFPIDDCIFHPTMENYLMIFTFSVIFCLSVVGNSIVVVVILQQRSMRSVTNLYLLNLALSDLLLSVVCMPPTLVSSLVYCWVFGDFLCKVLAYLQPVVVTASAYTLSAIALERYYAICRPLHSRVWHTRTHAMLVISLVWLVSVIANVFMLFMYEERTYNRNGLNCAPKFEPIVHFGYQIYMTVVLLVIPLVTMTALYANVIRTLSTGIRMDIASIEVTENNNTIVLLDNADQLPMRSAVNNGCAAFGQQEEMRKKSKSSMWSFSTLNERATATTFGVGGVPITGRLPMLSKQHSVLGQTKSNGSACTWKNTSGNGEHSLRSTHSGKTALAKQRLIRMLIVIVVIFFCCWTPSYIWWLLLNAQDAFPTFKFNIWNSELNTLITVLTYLSSCTNPITYCFLNNKFRNALCLTFGCRNGSAKNRSGHRRAAFAQQQQQSIGGYNPLMASAAGTTVPRSRLGTAENGETERQLLKLPKNIKKEQNCCFEMLFCKKKSISRLPKRRISTHGRRHHLNVQLLPFSEYKSAADVLQNRIKENNIA